MQPAIQVEGLAEINRALRKVDSDAPKALRVALNGVAEFLVDKTRPQIPKRTGAAAASLKAQSTRTSARIAVGGKRAPYYPWLDFGGRTGRRKATVREFITEGRYLFPTLGRERPAVERRLGTALSAVVKASGLDES